MSKLFKVETHGIMPHPCDDVNANDFYDAAAKITDGYESTFLECESDDDPDFTLINNESGECKSFQFVG